MPDAAPYDGQRPSSSSKLPHHLHSPAKLVKPASTSRNTIQKPRPQSANSRVSTTSSRTASSLNGPGKSASKDVADPQRDRMLSTPLVDYKHAANQTAKARAAASQRKSPSTSGTSSERKNALHSMESRQPAAKRDRSSGISSGTGSSGLTAVTSNEYRPADALARPFTKRNGKRVLRDLTLPYPLPCDLTEIHRQTIRTMFLCQVFNGPICSPAFDKKPPKRVFELGCGTGFWSVMCHRHFAKRGFTNISFTGMDIAPLAPAMTAEDDMNWRFVQHDLRNIPFPFRDEEFNLVVSKDMSLSICDDGHQQKLMDELIRILKPGGVLELQDGDHSIRMLLPQAAATEDELSATHAMGTYTLTPQTPMAAPQNPFFLDYNTWVSKGLQDRTLTDMPCTRIQANMHQEAELIEIDSRRLAIPLGEVRWEREGVGPTKGKGKEVDSPRILTVAQAALRRAALMNVIQFIESMEPVLREVSGKGQDEWDRWHGNMMADLLKNNGTSWGECLEVGSWWARKRKE